MADLTITVANIKPVKTGSNPSKLKLVTFGATILQGKTVYYDRNDGKWKVADGNVSAQVAGTDGFGISMCSGLDGQAGVVCVGGDVQIGGLTAGETYVQSATAGGIAPVADVSTNFVTTIGVAQDATVLRIPAAGALVSNVAHG